MAIYSDILMEGDDLVLDSYDQAVIIEDRDVIAQDLIHAIRESGYLVELIAERSSERRNLLLNKIILLAEEDTRIIPGTVEFTGKLETWLLIADTYEFGRTNVVFEGL